MSSNPQKFDRELAALKGLGAQNPLDPKRQQQLKAQLLAKIIDMPQGNGNGFVSPGKKHAILHYAFFSLLIFAFLGGTAYASVSSLPGDALYPVKRVKEKLQTAAAVSSASKAEVEAEQAQERIVELEKLKAKPAVTAPAEEGEERKKLEEKVEQEAETRVNHALETLTKVRTELQAKGNTKAVDAMDKNIQKLTAKALQARIKAKLPKLDKDASPSSTPDQIENGQVKGKSIEILRGKNGSDAEESNENNLQQKPSQQKNNGNDKQ